MNDMTDSYSITASELRQFIERIERLEQEKADLTDSVREVFAEAKGRGFDGKAMKRIIADRKKDPDTRSEEEAVLELYREALGMS